jgi:hypothetical protein
MTIVKRPDRRFYAMKYLQAFVGSNALTEIMISPAA